MTKLERDSRVDFLFKQIALIAEVKDEDHSVRDELISPLIKELSDLSLLQLKLGELPNQIYWSKLNL